MVPVSRDRLIRMPLRITAAIALSKLSECQPALRHERRFAKLLVISPWSSFASITGEPGRSALVFSPWSSFASISGEPERSALVSSPWSSFARVMRSTGAKRQAMSESWQASSNAP